LEVIHEEGLLKVLARHTRLSSALRAGCAALGLASFPQQGILSSTVVALHVPENVKGSDIVRRLYKNHGTVIAGSRNILSGRVIRIGTMGSVQEGDIVTDLLHLEAVLTELGRPVKAGAGVAAAVEVLDAR
jgi:aspartate aminotransferase-like enzyme